MCKQATVLEKIRKAKKVNGYGVELAEAQIEDYLAMTKDIQNLKQDVSAIKKTQIEQGKVQAEHGAKLDLIIARLNSPVEQERLDGQKWNLLVSITKHKVAWVILALCAISFALAGDRLAGIIEKLI